MNANSDDKTYVKLFRKILSWGWYGDTNTFRVFMHILLRANYRDSEYRGHHVPAGSCIFGRKKWAKELGLSEQQIRTAIDHLKSTQEITTKATNKFTVITLTNWEFWQIEEGKATKKSTNHQPTSNQQVTTSKESKKVRNTTPNIEEVRRYVEENDLNVDPDYFFKYYETAKWKDSRGKPVLNWKLKALSWSRRDSDANDNRSGNGERSGVRGRSGTGAAAAPGSGETVWKPFKTMEDVLREDKQREDNAGVVSG